jgi:hypothetical protein
VSNGHFSIVNRFAVNAQKSFAAALAKTSSMTATRDSSFRYQCSKYYTSVIFEFFVISQFVPGMPLPNLII